MIGANNQMTMIVTLMSDDDDDDDIFNVDVVNNCYYGMVMMAS